MAAGGYRVGFCCNCTGAHIAAAPASAGAGTGRLGMKHILCTGLARFIPGTKFTHGHHERKVQAGFLSPTLRHGMPDFNPPEIWEWFFLWGRGV